MYEVLRAELWAVQHFERQRLYMSKQKGNIKASKKTLNKM